MTRDETNTHRYTAPRAGLGHTETADEIADLIEQLGENSAVERREARVTLIGIGEPALPALLHGLAAGTFPVRWEIAKALSEMHLPGSIRGLVDALCDEEQDVRWLAAVGLSRMGRTAVVAALEALKDDPESTYLRQGVHHILTICDVPALRPELLRVRDTLGPFENDADMVPALQTALSAARAVP